MATISEERLRASLLIEGLYPLGKDWERAVDIFQNYGPEFSFGVATVLIYAVGRKKIEEVMNILEEHYRKRPRIRNPRMRGADKRTLDPVDTEKKILYIYKEVLGISSKPAA
jgi:hypothetical protein